MLAARTAALAIVATLAASAQITIQGIVRDASGASPIPNAHVLAIAGRPRSIVGDALTDAQGRYRLETSSPRFELRVEASGYYVVRAGDVEAESLSRACPEQGDCGEADFLLSRAAVVEGWITDAFGNPQQSLDVMLKPTRPQGQVDDSRRPLIDFAQERNRTARGATDDRGYFRFWGLRPGTYTLTTETHSTYYGIPPPPPLTRVIEIPAGEDSVRVQFQLTDAPQTFTFSGQIQGLEPHDRRFILLEPVSGGDHQMVQVMDGKFSSPVPAGEYVARLENVVNADPARSNADYLATLTIDRDTTGLELRPQPPAGVRARVVYVDSPPIPFRLHVRLKDKPESESRQIQFDGAETEIERHGLLPGDYISWVQARNYFLIEQPQFTVVPGQVTEVEFRLSNQRATIRGTARFAEQEGKREAAHITVGVRGRNTRSVQTDGQGGFLFERLIPGDYDIAAWARPIVDVESDEVWKEAGDRVRRVTVGVGFEAEVDLTIAP